MGKGNSLATCSPGTQFSNSSSVCSSCSMPALQDTPSPPCLWPPGTCSSITRFLFASTLFSLLCSAEPIRASPSTIQPPKCCSGFFYGCHPPFHYSRFSESSEWAENRACGQFTTLTCVANYLNPRTSSLLFTLPCSLRNLLMIMASQLAAPVLARRHVLYIAFSRQ